MLTHGVDKDDAMTLANVDVDVVLAIGEVELPPVQDAPTVWSLPDKVNETGNDTASRSMMPFSRDMGDPRFNAFGQVSDLPKSQRTTKAWSPWFFRKTSKASEPQKINASTSVII